MATQQNPLKLADARRMRLAAMNAISKDDVTDMMKAMLKRAKEGDMNAAKFVLAFLTTGTREGGADKSQQVVIVNQPGAAGSGLKDVINTPAGMMEKYAENPDQACTRCSMYEREEGSKLCMTCRNCEKQQSEFTTTGDQMHTASPKEKKRIKAS